MSYVIHVCKYTPNEKQIKYTGYRITGGDTTAQKWVGDTVTIQLNKEEYETTTGSSKKEKDKNNVNFFLSIHKDVWLLALSLFAWGFGLGLYTNIFSIVAESLGAKESEIALIFSVSFIISTLSYIPGGIFADKYNRKFVLLIGWTIGTPSALIFAFAQSWHWLVLGQLLYYVSNFCMPAFWAHLLRFCNKHNAGFTYSFTSSAFSLSMIISPAIGGLLAETFDTRLVFIISFISFLVSTLFLFGLENSNPNSNTSSNFQNDANIQKTSKLKKSNFEYFKLLSDMKFVLFSILFCIVTIVINLSKPYLPLFLWSEYKFNYAQIGLLSAIAGLGAVTLQLVLGRLSDKKDKYHSLAYSILIFGISYLILVLSRDFIILMSAFFMMGAANATSSIANSIVGMQSKEGSEGKAFALFSTITGVALSISPFLGGFLYSEGIFMPFYVTLLIVPFVSISLFLVSTSRFR
ncbi:MAG: MFS transporter [Thermoplasmata archaeon]